MLLSMAMKTMFKISKELIFGDGKLKKWRIIAKCHNIIHRAIDFNFQSKHFTAQASITSNYPRVIGDITSHGPHHIPVTCHPHISVHPLNSWRAPHDVCIQFKGKCIEYNCWRTGLGRASPDHQHLTLSNSIWIFCINDHWKGPSCIRAGLSSVTECPNHRVHWLSPLSPQMCDKLMQMCSLTEFSLLSSSDIREKSWNSSHHVLELW